MEITKRIVGRIEERDVLCYELKGKDGFQVNVLNYGGIITDIITPDRDGRLESVVLSYGDIKTYEENPSYFGAIIGRTSGRICDGRVELDGKIIDFNKNYGLHQGHGGSRGFNKKFWNCSEVIESNRVTLKLSCFSYDGEENYPGNVEVRVEYIVTDENEFIIKYYGNSDRKTLLNLTNHSYFNLSGNVKDDVLEQELYINGDYILEIDETYVPTGRYMVVESTPFDFRKAKKIGEEIDDNHPQIKLGSGYDHPWVLNTGDSPKVKLRDNKSGRTMEVYTDYNYVVVYSMNFPDDNILSVGRGARRRDGICFETQNPPIGRNQCFLEDSILDAGDAYERETRFKFYTLK